MLSMLKYFLRVLIIILPKLRKSTYLDFRVKYFQTPHYIFIYIIHIPKNE